MHPAAMAVDAAKSTFWTFPSDSFRQGEEISPTAVQHSLQSLGILAIQSQHWWVWDCVFVVVPKWIFLDCKIALAVSVVVSKPSATRLIRFPIRGATIGRPVIIRR